MHIWEYVMISGTWNPGFQDSRSALELANFGWYQHVGYESHSVYVKKLDFKHRNSKFHHSWKLPEIFWYSGYCLEMANFLPILTNWASFQLNFCHWTWILPWQSKNVMFRCLFQGNILNSRKLLEVSRNDGILKFCIENHVPWLKTSGKDTLYVEIS